jgi:hypothetical protein
VNTKTELEIEREKNIELKELEKDAKNQSSLKKRWNRRYYSHFIINFCFLVVFLVNWIAYKTEVYSIYTFDLFEHLKKNFYENGNFTYFKFHPYSHFIKECNTNDTQKAKYFFFDYFELNETQDFFSKNLKNLEIMDNSRIYSNYTRFIKMNEKIDNLTIAEFKAISSNNTEIPWDIYDEEQINFFLHPLNNYKYLSPPRNLNLF